MPVGTVFIVNHVVHVVVDRENRDISDKWYRTDGTPHSSPQSEHGDFGTLRNGVRHLKKFDPRFKDVKAEKVHSRFYRFTI